MRSGLLIHLLSWLAAAIVGALYGVAGTVAHSVMWGPVPIGLIVAGVAALALLVAIRSLTHDRWAALAAGLGMLAVVGVLSGTGPGGSVLLPDTPLAQTWLWVIAGAVLVVIAWPNLSKLAPPPGAASRPAEDRRLEP